MRLNLFFVIFILFVSKEAVFGQNQSVNKGGYTAFYENFYNNRNNWPVQSGENYSFSVKERLYDMNSSMEIMIAPVVRTPFDHSRDYSITCILEHISGSNENGYGLTFSYKTSADKYQFQLASQGYYRVIRSQNNIITQVVPWTASDVILKDDDKLNKLMIRKKGNICELYINDNLVNSFENFENDGDYTGFVIENKQHVVATLLTIEYN